MAQSTSSTSTEPSMSQMNPFDDDDDASWGSVDAVDDMIAGFSGSTKAKNSADFFPIDCIIDPLYELDNGGGDPTKAGWQTMFSVESEIPRIAATVSHGSSFDHEGGKLEDNDIETMMTSDILDVPLPDTIDLTDDNHAGHKRKRSMNTITTTPSKIATIHPKTLQAAAAHPPVEESINRIMMFLHYHEPDRHLVARAHGVVHSCATKYLKQGPRAAKELSGKIFEGLVELFGGDRFNAIYRGAMTIAPPPPPPPHYHPHYSMPEMHHPYVDPRQQQAVSLELAIAYGMHVAGMTTATTSGAVVSEQVQHGMHSLHTMTESEREMFWQYAVAKQEGL